MRRLWISVLALAFMVPAWALKPHVHGEGHLDVATDGSALTLELRLPLEVVVGFERPPRDDRQRQALNDGLRALEQAQRLFAPSAAAQCQLRAATVGEPSWNDAGHGDVQAHYSYTCAQPAALRHLETAALFERFKRLHRLHVQRIGPQGQGAARLTRAQPVLRW